MAVGRGGVRTGGQRGGLTAARQGRYDDVYLPASEALLRGDARSVREALMPHLGHAPTGRDYAEFRDLAGDGPRDWQRLYRGDEPMPILAPDGVYDALPTTWRQRSLIGEQWSLVARSRRLT